MTNRFLTAVSFSALALAAASAQAGLVVTLSEQTISGSTAIVAEYAGSLDLSAVPLFGTATIGSGSPYYVMDVEPTHGILYLHPGNVHTYLITPQGGAFGTGTGMFAYVRSPETLGSVRQYSYASPAPAYALTGTELGISNNYIFGSPISGTTNFLTTTFADWGLTPGSSTQYTINGTPETVTINVVPEPATYAMAVAGIACGGFSMWRRRKRA